MTQVRPCRHARPVLQREERNAAPEFVREPRRGLPRPSEPSSLVRPFGSREVLCISSTLDEIDFSALLLQPDFTSTNRTNHREIIPDLRSNVIVAQCSTGVKMPTMESLACPARGPAGSATAAGRPPPTLHSRPKPALCEGWSAAGTLVRKTSRVTTPSRADDGPSMLNQVVFVKSLEVVPFCCFLLEAKTLHRTEFSICATRLPRVRSWIDARRTDWGRTDPRGFLRRYDHASRPSRDGWPRAGTPRSQVRDIPDSVSFRPVGRVRTALLGTWVTVSREVSKSSQIVSDGDTVSRQMVKSR
jgi:hypothetical protein